MIADLATLSEKAKAVQRGRPALLLVNGAPGVGKSALIGQLEEFVRKQNGRFVTGKFDQYKRNVPYLSLIQAFQQLIGQLLSGTKERARDPGDRAFSTALGNNAQVVIDVIPEVELITGPQPAGSGPAAGPGAQPLQPRVYELASGLRAA